MLRDLDLTKALVAYATNTRYFLPGFFLLSLTSNSTLSMLRTCSFWKDFDCLVKNRIDFPSKSPFCSPNKAQCRENVPSSFFWHANTLIFGIILIFSFWCSLWGYTVFPKSDRGGFGGWIPQISTKIIFKKKIKKFPKKLENFRKTFKNSQKKLTI